MVVYVILDFFLGIVPFLGDVLDNLFKANLKNLQLLEVSFIPIVRLHVFATRNVGLTMANGERTQEHLLSDETYNILLMPRGNDFIPPAKAPPGSGYNFFARKAQENGTRKAGEKGRRTRRMEPWEGSASSTKTSLENTDPMGL